MFSCVFMIVYSDVHPEDPQTQGEWDGLWLFVLAGV